MSEIVLYCPEPRGLKLGPGITPQELIEFRDGFARFDAADFPDWEQWVNHPGTPRIEVLSSDSDQVPENTPDAFACPECGKAFAAKKGLQGHLMSHAKK